MKKFVVAQTPVSIGGKAQPETALYVVKADTKEEAAVFTHSYSRLTSDLEIDEDNIFFKADEKGDEWSEYSKSLVEKIQQKLEVQGGEESLTIDDSELGGYTVTSTNYSISELELFWESATVARHQNTIGLPVARVGEFQ